MAYVGAAAAIAALGTTIYQGEEQKRQAKKSRRLQEQAQNRQFGAALAEQQLASERERRQRARKPNVAAMLADIQAQSGGLESNLLTGPGGIEKDKLRLGTNEALGG
ncbi:MAG: hypothetical protein KDE27_05440 [Planctomycetes bacterium]|nr:hypothetical protein [Planctomycetota bacterium]